MKSPGEVLISLISGGSAILIMLVGVSIWRFDIAFEWSSRTAAVAIGRSIGILSIATVVLLLAHYLFKTRIWSILYALASASASVALLIPSVRVVYEGPKGAGTAAAGIGFLIGLVVSAIGMAGVLAAWFAIGEVKERKTAQPGATGNPDDAQRLREDN